MFVVKLAVILAAGMGTRLHERTLTMPKSFLPMGDSTLIERSLSLLKNSGIQRVVIGTGHEPQWFDELLIEDLSIQMAHNPQYNQSGSLETWIRMRDMIHEDFLLLESDLLYEKKALSTLIDADQKENVLASGFTNSGDEVWIETGANGRLITMNKDKTKLKQVNSELVGINRVSYEKYTEICLWADQLVSPTQLHYEDALTCFAKRGLIHVECIDDLLWAEIDNEQHLERAMYDIWPKIKEKEIVSTS